MALPEETNNLITELIQILIFLVVSIAVFITIVELKFRRLIVAAIKNRLNQDSQKNPS